MEMNAVVIGGSNIDVCAKSSNPLIKKDSNIGKIEFGLGGVARNIAEDLSLFGANTSLLTAIAHDGFGKVVTDNAREQGVSLLEEPFNEKGFKTGLYAYVSDNDGSFVVGVNDMDITSLITPQVIKRNINALSFTDYVVFEANLNKETIEEIASHDFKLVADCVSSLKCSRLENVLGKLYLIKANLTEAYALTGADNKFDAVKGLAGKGVSKGIVTLGQQGALCFEKQKDAINWFEITNLPESRVVDTSGCGDALLSGFLIGLMRDRSLSDCLYFGQSAACLNAESFSSVNRNMSYSLLKEKAEEFKSKVALKQGVIK